MERLFAAYEAGDTARLAAVVDERVVVRALDGEEVQGRERLTQRLREHAAVGPQTKFTTHAVIGQDQCVLVTGRRRISEPRGHSDRPAAWVMRFSEEGLLVESTAFASRDEAERMFPVLC